MDLHEGTGSQAKSGSHHPLRYMPTLIPSLQNVIVYETKTVMLIVGSDKCHRRYRMLSVNRSKSSALAVFAHDDGHEYSQADVREKVAALRSADPGCRVAAEGYGLVGLVKFGSSFYVDVITGRRHIGTLCGQNVYAQTQSQLLRISPDPQEGAEDKQLRRLYEAIDFSNAQSFFSYGYDVTNTAQRNVKHALLLKPGTCRRSHGLSKCNDKFVWNSSQLQELITCIGDSSSLWVQPIVRGFFAQKLLRTVNSRNIRLTLIARRSRHFAGTRFLRRGINGCGHVANEVETEQVLADASPYPFAPCSSFVQMRGSVPLHWANFSLSSPRPYFYVYKKDGFASSEKHFLSLGEQYAMGTAGKACDAKIYVLNLLRRTETVPRETIIVEAFDRCIDTMQQRGIPVTCENYDFHGERAVEGKDVLQEAALLARKLVDEVMCFSLSAGNVKWQTGVVRTNCSDCLDRTNVMQFMMGREALRCQASKIGLCLSPESYDQIWKVMLEMYTSHGDAIGIQYGGSVAMHRLEVEAQQQTATTAADGTSRGQAEDDDCTEKGGSGSASIFTGSRVILTGTFANAVVAMNRFLANNFRDEEKQRCMNAYLGIKEDVVKGKLAEVDEKDDANVSAWATHPGVAPYMLSRKLRIDYRGAVAQISEPPFPLQLTHFDSMRMHAFNVPCVEGLGEASMEEECVTSKSEVKRNGGIGKKTMTKETLNSIRRDASSNVMILDTKSRMLRAESSASFYSRYIDGATEVQVYI
eukprot:g2156.t1